MIKAHHWAIILKFAVTAAMSGAFLVLLVVGTSGQALSVEGQLAVQAEKIKQNDADINSILVEIRAVRAQVDINSNRLTRIEMAGAAFALILGFLQAFATVTGRTLGTRPGPK